VIDMRKYAGELRVGDIWTERRQDRAARSYRVIAIAPGLAPITIRVTGECVRRTIMASQIRITSGHRPLCTASILIMQRDG
jgi:hypothetical protein